MSETKNEAEILHPEREVTIDGRKIVMREYTWVEGMRLEAVAKPVLDALVASSAKQDEPTVEEISAVLSMHPEIMVKLIAAACDQPEDWVVALSDANGSLLYWLFWAVNSGFFIRRLQTRVAMLQARKTASVAAGQSGQKDRESETS